MKSKLGVSLILPVYNEEAILEKAVKRCHKSLENDFEFFEIILINDGSKDSSLIIMHKLKKELSNIEVLDNLINLNQGVSIQRGLKAAKHEIVLHNGIDLPFDVSELKALLEKNYPFDLFGLEREKYKGATRWRKFVSKTNHFIRSAFYPFKSKGILDMNFIQIYNREIINQILPLAKSPAFTTPEMIYRANHFDLNVKSATYVYHARSHGSGSLGKLHDIVWTIYDMIRFKYLLIIGLKIHGKVK